MNAELFTIVTVGELLDDLELLRIATTNRIAALEREIGGRFPHLDELSSTLATLENDARLELGRHWRKHPLAPWGAEIPGLGEKQFARLIAVIGDPSERPNVAKLWQFCGHGRPGGIPPKATQAQLLACGSPHAKKRVYLIASQFVRQTGANGKSRSPYRDTYEKLRAKYETRDWTPAHKDAAARRELGKVFLRDLWVESRRLAGLSTTAKRGKRGGVKHRSAA